MMNRKLQVGFTLTELLTTIAIIAVLAGALLPALSKAREMAKKRIAREEIHQIEIALRTYVDDYGTYPGGDGNGCEELILALEADVENGPYCTWPDDRKSGNELVDPWRNAYRYDDTAPSSGAGMTFKIWSTGPDGPTGDSDDDITNW